MIFKFSTEDVELKEPYKIEIIILHFALMFSIESFPYLLAQKDAAILWLRVIFIYIK